MGAAVRADARASRAEILRAARSRYAARGTDASLRSIAAEAGVGIATLYRHFPDQQALVMGIVGEVRTEVLAASTDAQERWAADPADAWTTFVRRLAQMRLGALLPRLAGELRPLDLPEEAMAYRQEGMAAITTVLHLAQEAGLVRLDVKPLTFHVGLALITRPMPEEAIDLLPDVSDWLVEVYLRGLRPDEPAR